MKFVYILQSPTDTAPFDTGITDDLKHNSSIAFTDEARAISFEKYWKSGSDRAFARARLFKPRAAF